MSKINSIFKKTISNPPILYVISRYGTYFIQLINSLLIANYLGPYYLGIWGFINLVLNYTNQLNFGIYNSVNVIISVEKGKKEYVLKVIGNGLTMIMTLCIIIIIFFLVSNISGLNIGEKYNLNTFFVPVLIIAILTHFNSLFSTVFRVYGKIFEIAINQSLYPILMIFLIPFFRGYYLLWAMIYANSIAVLISLILFLIRSPVKFNLLFDINIMKQIQKKGWYLFIFNTSFALILITTQSFISRSYSVKEFGYFTFSYSISNSILLFLNAISYLIFPKMLNRFANGANKYVINILGSVRSVYISTSHLLMHFIIMIFPIILIIFPEFKESNEVFKVISLTVALYANSYGFQTLLISRGKEKTAAIISFSALVLNIILVFLSIYILDLHFSYIMFATMISYFIYVLLSGIVGKKELEYTFSIKYIFRDIFPFRMFIPYLISIILILIQSNDVYFIIPFVLYILFNINDLKEIKELIIKLIRNPNFVNI
jgi:O-antigen/teichoic acid export membrane protein